MLEQMTASLRQNLSDEERAMLKKAITPDIGMLLIKGIPELAPLIEPLLSDDIGAPASPPSGPMQAPMPKKPGLQSAQMPRM